MMLTFGPGFPLGGTQETQAPMPTLETNVRNLTDTTSGTFAVAELKMQKFD